MWNCCGGIKVMLGVPFTWHFYLSILMRKPNAVKSFHLLMAPGKPLSAYQMQSFLV